MSDEIQDAEIIDVSKESIDSRTGEIIPKGSPNTMPPAGNVLQLQINANTIGTLVLSPETEKVLDEPLDPKSVRIRPDGLVYLPWTFYAEKLNKAFGRLQWGLVPQGAPQSKDTGNNNVLVIWGNWLVVKGIPVGFAVGETSYRTNNNTMSYADAIEGAKSISLARNCKILGVALDLWDAEWVANWKKQYAEKVEGKWQKKQGKSNPSHKPVAKPVATVGTNEDQLNKDFPPVVKEAVELGGEVVDTMPDEKVEPRYNKEHLMKVQQINAIKELAGVDTPTVIAAVQKLEKGHTYTASDVATIIKQGENK